jgi:hypothetical protein
MNAWKEAAKFWRNIVASRFYSTRPAIAIYAQFRRNKLGPAEMAVQVKELQDALKAVRQEKLEWMREFEKMRIQRDVYYEVTTRRGMKAWQKWAAEEIERRTEGKVKP